MIDLKEFLTEEIKQELREAYELGNLKFIEKDNNTLGFFSWFEIRKNNKLYIYVNNLWIQPEYRSKTPLFWIRKFLKNKYPYAEFGYWTRDNKKDYWHYSKRRRLNVQNN